MSQPPESGTPDSASTPAAADEAGPLDPGPTDARDLGVAKAAPSLQQAANNLGEWPWWLPFLFALAVFAVDLFLSHGVAWPMLYSVAMLACLRTGMRGRPAALATIASVFTVVAWAAKQQGDAEMAMVAANRVLSILVLWITGALVAAQRKASASLRQQREIAQSLAESAQMDRDALFASQRQLQDLQYALDQSAIVAVTDPAGKITYANEKFCNISGYGLSELLGRDHRIVNSQFHSKEFFADLWKTIGHGRIWRGEVRNRAKDGEYYWVDTTIVPVQGAQDKTEHYISIRFDITARKLAETRLREQEALARLGEMATVVAHEVRNPLAGIAGALQIIGGRMAADSEEKMIVGDMIERIGALNATLSDMLLYARPRSPQRREVNLLLLLEELQSAMVTDPRFGGVQVFLAGDPVLAEVDGQMIRGALLNLAINAVQAMHSSGVIHLFLAQRNHQAEIRVVDTGPGIPLAVRQKVFEPFFTTKSRGTGLGLPIVRRVATQHDGDLEIDCPPEGGTVVTMRLPLAAVHDQPDREAIAVV